MVSIAWNATVVSSISLLAGGLFLGISTSFGPIFENPIWYVSIGLIISGIVIQAKMNVNQESEINHLKKTEIPELKLQLNEVNLKLSSLQSQIDNIETTLKDHIHPLEKILVEFIDKRFELETLKKTNISTSAK